MHHLEVAKVQAQLKELLNRSQSSPDIEPADPSETPLPYTYDELLAATEAQNPQIAGAEKMIERQKLQVDLAHKDFYPDFNVQYMWQRTDPAQFRAYYMLSVGVRVPIYRSRKQRPELAQAEAELSRSRSELEVQSQQAASELKVQYETAQKTAELLKIYKEGLLPQARAGFQAGLAAYQNNRQDFQSLLSSFLDVLHLDEEYWQNISRTRDGAGTARTTHRSVVARRRSETMKTYRTGFLAWLSSETSCSRSCSLGCGCIIALAQPIADAQAKTSGFRRAGFHGHACGRTPCIDGSASGSGANLSATIAEHRREDRYSRT